MAATGPSVHLTPRHRPRGLRRRRPGRRSRAAIRDRIAQSTAKDVRAEVIGARQRRAPVSFLDGVLAGMFTVPGDGARRLSRAVLAGAADIGYSGWIVVEAEQDPAIADPARPMPSWAAQRCEREADAARA